MLERGRTNFNDVRAKYTEKAPSRWSVRERCRSGSAAAAHAGRTGAFGQNEISRVNFRFGVLAFGYLGEKCFIFQDGNLF